MRISASALLLALALLLVAPWSTASAAPDSELESITFTIKFKEVEDVLLLLKPLIGDQGSFTVHPRLKAITVMDEGENLVRIGQILADFDQPPRSVRLSIQVLMATEVRPSASSSGTAGAGVTELIGDVTKWPEVTVIGSASILGVEGAESSLNVGDEFRVRFSVDTVAPAQGVVKFGRFALDRVVQTAEGGPRHVPIWDTVVNLRNEQRLLIGATSSQESKRAIFLSVTANIEPDNRAPAAN